VTVPPPRSAADHAESWAASLRRLHALVRSVNADLDLGRTLTAVCHGLVEGLGFGVAVVNLVLPSGDLEVVACEGDDGACAALLGQRGSRGMWDDWMAQCDEVGSLLVDYRHVEWTDDVPTWVPDIAPLSAVGAWHPEDALLAPLRTRGSGLLGVISVDLPRDGMRPGPEQLELLEMYAAQASVAVEKAQLHSSLKERDEARARALGRLTALVKSAPVAIVELDLEGRVRLWNAAAERIFGWAEGEVLGERNPVAPEPSYEQTLHDLRTDTSLRQVQVTRTRRDGATVDVDMTTSALVDDAGATYGYLGVYVDVTSRTELERELRTAAFTDPLTGLANRARFTACCRQAGDDATVVLLDLDGFKGVNDTLGHAAGDRVLVEVADRLRAVCRDDDLVARLGGDEFVVLVSSPAGEADLGAVAVTLADRVVVALSQPFLVAERLVSLGASVGVAHARDLADEADPGDALLRDADIAMYAAKAAGKGRVRVFEPMLRDAVLERSDLVADLRAAIERDDLQLRYQPVVAVPSGQVRGLAAVAVWDSPARGVLPAEVWLPLAEQAGLVAEVGSRLLWQACAALSGWHDRPAQRRLPPERRLPVSVRVWPTQLRAAGFVTGLRALLRATGTPPACLVLELPEQVLADEPERTTAVLEQVRGLGVRLALDSVGSRGSSLAAIVQLPLDVATLDSSLVLAADTGDRALALLEAVVGLTRRLGLLTVAEGVRTRTQWELLGRLGCDAARGPFVADPVAAPDVAALLSAGPLPA
jgi:diguanylate cyclase (GGDEF)-like protein/PAS domain S-box-containing protein